MYTAAYYGVRSPNLICTVSLRMASYERFAAWKLSYDLALKVYDTTDSFPRSELYGLTSQIRRAAFSVAANIAEGRRSAGGANSRRYLDIALGSRNRTRGRVAPGSRSSIHDARSLGAARGTTEPRRCGNLRLYRALG